MSAAASPEEHRLLERARTGDEDAFAQIVARHADRVYGALRRFGLAPGDAEDVAQEVFLRAWRGLDRFEGRAQLSTWLYWIAFNEAQRRRGRSEPVTARADPEGAAPRALELREAAFKSRLHRGRMQLRGLLEPYLELGEA